MTDRPVRQYFIIGSVAFHAILLIVALLMPPPFPSRHESEPDLSYVELKPEEVQKDTPVPDKDASARGDYVTFKESPETLPLIAGDVTVRGETQAGEPFTKGIAGKTAFKGEETSDVGRHKAAHEQPESKPAPKTQAEPAKAQSVEPEAARPSGQKDRSGQPTPDVQVAEDETGLRGVVTDRASVNFKYQKGWPAPGMVSLKVEAGGKGGKAAWRAQADEDWIIITPKSGAGPGSMEVGADLSRMKLGFYDGTVKIKPVDGSARPCEVAVTAMVLPKDAGTPDLPHSSFDAYMNGECKVCHLPKEVMPTADFMVTPEFCNLCHTSEGMAADKVINGGHPVMVEAGSGGTKTPTFGRVLTGPKSDMMSTHLKDGRLIVCVTCHNVMEKPHDYGRTWEMASSDDRKTYQLYHGGWANMGYLAPRVYATDGVMQMPHFLKDTGKYLIAASEYTYDETDGSVRFNKPRAKAEVVYVTLENSYLRVTTENNALCYDCHHENTHEGMNCMTCHEAHGTANIKLVRRTVRTGGGSVGRVVFRSHKGKNSFADGSPAHDGICEACHPLHRHKDGKDYAGTDCTKCHSHKNGFGA